MAKQTVVRSTTHKRQKKIPKDSIPCNICRGKGYIQNWHKKKK